MCEQEGCVIPLAEKQCFYSAGGTRAGWSLEEEQQSVFSRIFRYLIPIDFLMIQVACKYLEQPVQR